MTARTIAIGDVHGCSAALEALIKAIDPAPDDRIITLGDYVDRGPDSRGVLDFLIELAERCRLVPLLGNHDQAMLDVRSRRIKGNFWIGIGGMATLASYGAAWGELDKVPEAHFAFLEACVPAFETDSHLFFHAQYDPRLPIAEQPEDALRWNSLRESVPEPHCSGKRAFVGHSSQKTGEILDLGHIVCIDTFCYGGKWLTALDVGSGQVWQADAHGRLRST